MYNYNRFNASKCYEEGHGDSRKLMFIGTSVISSPAYRDEVYGYNRYLVSPYGNWLNKRHQRVSAWYAAETNVSTFIVRCHRHSPNKERRERTAIRICSNKIVIFFHGACKCWLLRGQESMRFMRGEKPCICEQPTCIRARCTTDGQSASNERARMRFKTEHGALLQFEQSHQHLQPGAQSPLFFCLTKENGQRLQSRASTKKRGRSEANYWYLGRSHYAPLLRAVTMKS